jgi:Fur family peroxide stress response transcriptional regulator
VNPISSEIANSFRRHGLRCTTQRYAVLQYLLKHPNHPTVEEIRKAINRRDPRASRATVYNSLHALVEAGLIREVTIAGQATRFECHIERHHHFVCDRCGRIEDVEWFDFEEAAKKSGITSYSIREVVFQGQCASCLSRTER